MTTQIEAKASYRIGESGNKEEGFPQALLKRKTGTTIQEFQDGWIEHARRGLPWAVECGMTHYVQIVDPVVANPDKMPPNVDIMEFDGVVEILVPENSPGTEAEKARRAAYFTEFIIPDECRVFRGPNRDLAVWVPPNTLTGKRIEFMVDGEWIKDSNGNPLLDMTETTKEYKAWKKAYELRILGDQKQSIKY